MNMHGDNVDRSTVDQENLDYFKTLIRHLQRIPDNKILLFRQEVDALLLKYAHHYVRKDSETVTREKRRRKYDSTSESESEEESVPLPAAKVERRKSKVQSQTLTHKRLRQSQPVVLSDDDDILVVKEIKTPPTSNISSVKEEPASEQSRTRVKRERNVSTPAHCHQKASQVGASHSGTSGYDNPNQHYAPQQSMPNDQSNFNNATRRQVPMHQQQMNNTAYHGHGDYTNSHHRDHHPGFNPPISTQYPHPSTSHPPQQPPNNRDVQPGFHQPPPRPEYAQPHLPHAPQQSFNNREVQPGFHSAPPPEYGHPGSLHPPQNPSNDRQMPPGFNHTTPNGHANSNESHPSQNQFDPAGSYNRQIMPQNPSVYLQNQQYTSNADSAQASNGQTTHQSQHGHVYEAQSTSAHGAQNTTETLDSAHGQIGPPTNSYVQPGTTEQPEVTKPTDKI